MKVNRENILNYIPQRPPFVMIDELVDANETYFESNFEIVESNFMVRDAELSEACMIENIAQTGAAGFGYLDEKTGKKAGNLGFIGAVTKVKNYKNASVGEKLNTKVNILGTFDKIHLVKGEVFSNDKLLFECQLKIALA